MRIQVRPIQKKRRLRILPKVDISDVNTKKTIAHKYHRYQRDGEIQKIDNEKGKTKRIGLERSE